eukprot:COSAG01_NODE_713_length_14097_cov_15.136448_17_plen_250_part_00
MQENFKEKIVVVTGGTRGIGQAIAKSFIQANATVIISGRSEEKAITCAEQLKITNNSNVEGLGLNLLESESCKKFIEKIIEKHNKIDVLINNAGMTEDNLILRMTEEQWTNVIQSNLTGSFLLSKYSIRSMLKKKKGRIINISSVIGQHGNAGQANYAASKGGLIAFTKSLAKEFASKGITCNAIAPGFIKTDMTDTLPSKQIEAIINHVPVKRMGHVEEIAHSVLFLASENAGYITGQTLTIDGGLYI